MGQSVRTALLACGLALLAGPNPARGDVLSTEDRVRLLYSERFTFDRRGIPLVTVRILEGLSQVAVSARSGLELLPLGPDGPVVSGASGWRIRVLDGRPAKVRYWVVVESRPGSVPGWARKRCVSYRRGGLTCRVFETGAVFAVSGTVVENRSTLVAVEPGEGLSEARAAVERVRRRFGHPVRLHAELVRRPSGRILAEEESGSIRVQGADVLWFRARRTTRPETVLVSRPASPGASRRRGRRPFARRYWGLVYAAVDRHGRLAVVNAVPADQLLAGLVPAEMFASAPMAALEAQAVAARGQLLVKIGHRHLADPYLLCATQHCQVYGGAGREHPRTTKAVRRTRGLVLVDRSGRLADTVFHAVCGGHTENAALVWDTPDRPYLRGVSDLRSRTGGRRGPADIRHWLFSAPDAYCKAEASRRGLFRWRVRRTFAELTRLARRWGLGRVGRVTGVRVLERGVSGRALRILLLGTRGREEVRGELRIRRLLGGLRSSMFLVRAYGRGARAGLEFLGGGWGHGAGMCQYGAMGRARAGWSFQRILASYYPGTRLLRLY